MKLLSVALVIGAYLYASIPLVYLFGRWRGVDLRRVHSGNVGGSNLWQTVGPLAGVIGAVFDATKGVLPPLTALLLGLGEGAAALSALVGVIGQCWPLFLLLPGGRGNSAISGAAFILLPRELAVAAVPMLLGWALRRRNLFRQPPEDANEAPLGRVEPMSRAVPLGMALGIGLLPILGVLLGEPPERVGLAAACFILMLVRRLTAGLRADWATAKSKGQLMVNRLLYDRSYR